MSFWGKKGINPSESSQAGSSSSIGTATTTPLHGTAPEAISPAAQTLKDEERYGKIRSALGPGTIIQGKLSFDTVVSIDGKLKGEVFSSKALIVGSTGVVDAEIDVTSLVVFGVVRGSVKVSERVEVRAGGQLLGDINAPTFIVEDGGVFSGNCIMPNK